MLRALSDQEQQYSVEISQKVVKEVKLELVCDNEQRLAVAIQAIRENARTDTPSTGWIYVTQVLSVIQIGG